MALSAPAKTQLGVAMASIGYAAEITTAIDAAAPSASPTLTGTITVTGATFAGASTSTGLETFTGGVTITTVPLTITDVNVVLSSVTGTQMATNNAQKFALWGATPVIQPSSTGELLGMNGNAATNANAVNMNSNGNSGSTLYTFSDVVKALKQLGALKS